MKEPRLTPRVMNIRFEFWQIDCVPLSGIELDRSDVDSRVREKCKYYLVPEAKFFLERIIWSYNKIFFEVSETEESWANRQARHAKDMENYKKWVHDHADVLAERARKEQLRKEERERLKRLREKAKAKLTPEERKALGLK